MRGRVQRLHLRMGGVRRFVKRFDDFAALRESALDVTVIARADHRPVERVTIEFGELRAVGPAGGADVPFRLQLRERLPSRATSVSAATATASSSFTTLQHCRGIP